MERYKKMGNWQKIRVILIILVLIIPIFLNSSLMKINKINPNLNSVNIIKEDEDSLGNLSSNQTQAETKLNLSKIFPLVLKNILRTDFHTSINFTIQNTMNIPLHNLSLTYYHIKDSAEEYPIYIGVHPDSTKFILNIVESDSKILFVFKLKPVAELSVGETLILSLNYSANILNSDLKGDGVEWNCSEILDNVVIYEIADPAQKILEPMRECAQLDFDQDGLFNIEEKKIGLDPFSPDF